MGIPKMKWHQVNLLNTIWPWKGQLVHVEAPNRWGYQHFLRKIINYQSVCTMIITENFLDFDNKLRYPQGEITSGDSNCYSMAMIKSTCTCKSPEKVGIQTFFKKNYQWLVFLHDDYYKKYPKFWWSTWVSSRWNGIRWL